MGTARVLRSWRAVAIISIVAVLLLSGTRADGRPAPARQPPPTIEIIPVENPDPINAPSLIVDDAAVWAVQGDDVHRVDVGATPLTGSVEYPPFASANGTHGFDEGTYWRVLVDPEAPPCTAAIPEVDPNLPYVLHGIDVATNTVTQVVPLPEWCAPRASRASWAGTPVTVTAAGGIVWVGHALSPGADANIGGASVRVDGATGVVTDVATQPLITLVADDGGAWGYAFSARDRTVTTTLGRTLMTISIDRVARDGTVVATNVLRGAANDPGTITIDADGLWVVTAKPPAHPDARPDTVLTRVTRSGRRLVVPGIHAWSLFSDGDGETWFVGSMRPIPRTPTSAPIDWVLGHIDTTTGRLLGTYHLDLPDELGHVASNDATPGVVLLGAGGGVVWLRAGIGSGTLVRVTVPAAPRG